MWVGERPKIKCKCKTYGSRYSLVVTHPTTNLPIYSLSSGERTGSAVLYSLWPYVKEGCLSDIMYMRKQDVEDKAYSFLLSATDAYC